MLWLWENSNAPDDFETLFFRREAFLLTESCGMETLRYLCSQGAGENSLQKKLSNQYKRRKK